MAKLGIWLLVLALGLGSMAPIIKVEEEPPPGGDGAGVTPPKGTELGPVAAVPLWGLPLPTAIQGRVALVLLGEAWNPCRPCDGGEWLPYWCAVGDGCLEVGEAWPRLYARYR